MTSTPSPRPAPGLEVPRAARLRLLPREPELERGRPPVLLDSTAARSCPVKTQNAQLPGLARPDRPLELAVLARRQAQAERRRLLLDDWLAHTPGAVDLRSVSETPVELRREAASAALRSGAPLIVGASLPVDPDGHRLGAPDALVRAADHRAGRPGYLPVVIKGHHVLTTDPNHGADTDPVPTLAYGRFDDPVPDAGRTLAGRRLKTGSRTGDFLQLAHYARLLDALGHAASGPAWGGVVGTDGPIALPDRAEPETLIGWLDLAQPLPPVGRLTPTDPESARSMLQHYDDEHRFRLAIAESARQQSGHPASDPPLLVGPVVTAECLTCPWWQICRPQLDDDDLGLRIERGRLWPREILALRALGVGTVTALADADPDALVDRLATRLGDRPGGEGRLRTATRRARMLVGGEEFARETSGPIDLPVAEVEIDFDLETAADGRIYLWGFWVRDGETAPFCRQFARFDDLDADGEIALAREALRWLQDRVEHAGTVRVYHYSSFEVARLRQLADRSDDPLLQWAADYAERDFVDLLEIAKTHFFGVSGLGLKAIARHAGFSWRDPDPGGLNSQTWFDEAVHGPADRRSPARRRVLEYNEDDVIATSRLRDWLRGQ